ncbi:histone-like nucleoid-structuring protein Lsr2 [Streptomyces syringium]|uniref:histone-like nucleoid-structuring protein Lsr2 n=1 Tax=Streptomyces syringium TaxID=76729 RepID=UPI003D9000AF
MAKRVETYLIDDVTEMRGDSVQTRMLAIDGERHEVDLGEDTYGELRAALAPYLEAGRKAKASKKDSASSAISVATEVSAADIRAWAKRRRIKVPARGRIPSPIRQQYEAAHGSAA